MDLLARKFVQCDGIYASKCAIKDPGGVALSIFILYHTIVNFSTMKWPTFVPSSFDVLNRLFYNLSSYDEPNILKRKGLIDLSNASVQRNNKICIFSSFTPFFIQKQKMKKCRKFSFKKPPRTGRFFALWLRYLSSVRLSPNTWR